MGLLSRVAESVSPGAFEGEIARYCKATGKINCVLFETPDKSSGEDHCQKINKFIDNLGVIFPLPSGQSLLLMPIAVDRELITHRLSKSFYLSDLLSFEADNPEIVINRINALG
jgi:hypothetical protein